MDPMADLMKLHQKTTVDQYYDTFDTIINKLNLLESYNVSCFLGGLRKDIKMMVHMFQPTIVHKAFSLVKIQIVIILGIL